MSARISWLDVKLGVRMLARHPALTLVGGLGLAVGVAISAAFFSVTAALVYPELPLEEGDRVVALENRDLAVNDEERRSLHDFVAWREELRSVRDLGAFRFVDRNLVVDGGPPVPVQVAEMTAAGFRVARVPPLLGRHLVEEDEREGAPPVVVIGHDVWEGRFAGDPAVVGRDVRLGGALHTVVGVMPEGFGFPMSQSWWTPLRADPPGHGRREGPEIFVFGRLAPGATLAEAQAELATIGRRAAAAFPETHAQLRPVVLPYTRSLTDMQGGVSLWELARMQLLTSLLLVVVALNVAVLVYARVAMRETEIAVRSALGASRRRIVAQLFVEALVLSAGAAAAGFALAQYAVRVGLRLFYVSELEAARAPFWLDYGLRPSAVLFTVGLAVLAAVIVGVLPALQVTGRLRSRLSDPGGGTGPRLGRTWTALIVAQVAVSVAVLPATVSLGWSAILSAATRPVFPAEEFLTTRLERDQEPLPAGAGAVPGEGSDRSGDRLAELMRRLEAEPAVAGVTYRAHLPGRGGKVQVDGVPAPAESPSGHDVGSTGVHPGYFDVFGARLLTGRGFEPRDLGEEATALIVSEAFVRQVLGGGGALGRRVRHVVPEEATGAGEGEAVRWYEVVGVVEDLEANPADPERVTPRVYYPVAPARVQAVTLAVRLRGAAPADFASRLREVAAAVDPSLRLGAVASMAEGDVVDRISSRGVGVAVVLVLLSVFLLSAAGIYALMSFAVTQRRREIGIRTALGAHPRQVLRSVFARAAGQLALGLAAGVGAATLLEGLTGGGLMSGRGAVILPALAVVMTAVGLLAALGPARRGLRIQPTEALRADA
ncbi:MAG TPA: ABC transporter permease [Longimicrobiaceae bacterium]|nr:ABC transporter permease [Longimicrobiaceae bacterium]